MKWTRIGYIEGRVKFSDTTTYVEHSILYVREPFLWFKTRKAVKIGDYNEIKYGNYTSQHYREYKRAVEDWLLGGKIDYVSDNGTNNPAEVIKLVKKD